MKFLDSVAVRINFLKEINFVLYEVTLAAITVRQSVWTESSVVICCSNYGKRKQWKQLNLTLVLPLNSAVETTSFPVIHFGTCRAF